MNGISIFDLHVVQVGIDDSLDLFPMTPGTLGKFHLGKKMNQNDLFLEECSAQLNCIDG